jgi:hypothetical protein
MARKLFWGIAEVILGVAGRDRDRHSDRPKIGIDQCARAELLDEII